MSGIKASPTARRLAEERGLQLEELQGTGPRGRVLKRDVVAAVQDGGSGDPPSTPVARRHMADADLDGADEPVASPARPSPGRASPTDASPAGDSARGAVTKHELSRLQRTVARRMAESKATAPDFTLETEVEMDGVVSGREQLKTALDEADPVPSFNDFVIKAAASALRAFPRANGAYRDGSFELHSRVNVGLAVAGDDALLVPTVFDADAKSLLEIAAEARILAERVRAGTISPPELAGGTFTISNLGMFGITSFAAVINPPQAAILAVGAMTPTPVIREGEVTKRTVMRLTLTCDHRILHGADAAQFLGRIRELLERPVTLAI